MSPDGEAGLSAEPSEDVGAATQSRYAYQRHLVVRRCLQILAGVDDIVSVICEWHTDYVAIRGDAPELVSVKHQEESQNPWTLVGLCGDGGLQQLYERWVATGETCRVTIETNRGLKAGDGAPAELLKACRRGNREELLAWAGELVGRLAPDSADRDLEIDRIATFLGQLNIVHDLPKRYYIRDIQLRNDAEAACEALGLDARAAENLYDCIYALVENVSQNDVRSVVTAMLRGEGDLDEQTQRVIGAKTIDGDLLRRAIARCQGAASAVNRRASNKSDEPVAKALVEKMRRGGFGPTNIADARHLRIDWLLYERQMSELTGEQAPYHETLQAVRAAAAEAERAVDRNQEPYGEALYEEVIKRLDDLQIDGAWLQMDRRRLLGALFELTEQCTVWWSTEFDVESQ